MIRFPFEFFTGFCKPKHEIRYGFIIPHTKKAKGAHGNATNEYDYAIDMVSWIDKIPFVTRDNTTIFNAVSDLIRFGRVNATIEPHKNAYNKKAHGFEILVLKNDLQSEKAAREIISKFTKMFPLRRLRQDGGIKWISEHDRGYLNLKSAKTAGVEIALLTEPFFIDNPGDWISPEEMAVFWNLALT